jgi:thiol-disulfide isomerase/thioredoxin
MHSVKIDRALRFGIGLLAVVLVYFIWSGIRERVVSAGDSAPGFTITADNGRAVSLPGFGGKILVLNFWATWCPPCVEETPSLSRFAQEFGPKGVVVLGVSVDRSEQAYKAFLNRFKPAFLTARDSELHEKFGTFMYPETYIIDAQGKVLQKLAEPADWMNPKLTGYIASLL